MLKEKIEKYFARDPELRVLFFFDGEKVWKDEVMALQFETIEVLFRESNDFYLKSKLHTADPTLRIFLYLPSDPPRTQSEMLDFPLLDLLLTNKELSLEDEGEFIQEFGLQRQHMGLVKKYIKELKYAHVQEVCKPILTAGSFSEPELIRGLLSAFLKLNRIESWPVILGRILMLARPEDDADFKRFYKKLHDNNLQDLLNKTCKDWLATSFGNFDQPRLKRILLKVQYNLITANIPQACQNDRYKALKLDKKEELQRLVQFVIEMERHERLGTAFMATLAWASEEIHGEHLIEAYGIDQSFAVYNSAMVYALIGRIQSQLDTNPKLVTRRLSDFARQKDLPLNQVSLIKFMLQLGAMLEGIGRISSYVFDRPEEYIKQYVSEWHKVDYAYRQGISYLNQFDLQELSSEVQVEKMRDILNDRYEKHCEIMNREWLKCLSQFNFDYKAMPFNKQYSFYDKFVEPYEQKVVVIVSDALRYEAADQLLSELHSDPRNTAKITYQMAGLPSKTFMGMAQLLPGKEFYFGAGEGKITIDGFPTQGTDHRTKLLAHIRSNACAVQYEEVKKMSQEKSREFFKRSLVYIYHDVIDATGDKGPTEYRAFVAVREAIEDLKQLVKNLHATQNVARVLITADHGFLYNDRKIEDVDKERFPDIETLSDGNRYAILKEAFKPDLGYCVPLGSTTAFKDDLYVLIPESVNRYRKQGVRHQFAHGGGSLQELVVPVIESSRKEQKVTTQVQALLMQSKLVIVANVLPVSLFQENKVSRNEKERTVLLGIYSQDKLVSNTVTVILNSTSDNPTDRMHRINLSLLPEAFDSSVLKLRVFDETDMLNPLIEHHVINKNLIEPDF